MTGKDAALSLALCRLVEARDKFKFYEEAHRAKRPATSDTEHKAEVNARMVARMQEAIDVINGDIDPVARDIARLHAALVVGSEGAADAGLSKREWLAGQALAGAMAQLPMGAEYSGWQDAVAFRVVSVADAALRKLAE